ncbi:vitamin B6 photo-protection and homoeostasis-domain-containing protein [Gorgonomyces haynaldii]|nr:vitamin B6 photo-protection and homoeostasis-domain-containing protein [Gorgonomyces haynaldii]
MFLPVGFPSSVHKSYLPIHVWQFLETTAGSLISVLTAQAMLVSVGAGNAAMAGTAVAIQWALKDGLGEMGKLLIIRRFAHNFDTWPKTWKMIGEVSSVLGAFMQLLTALVPGSFLLFASLGYGLRSIHFAIWNATHTTFNQNLAIQGNNIGDIVAKDEAQFAVAHILGMALGIAVLEVSHDPLFLAGVFSILGGAQLWMTQRLVTAAQFPVLSLPTLQVLAHHFVKQGKILNYKEAMRDMDWTGEWIKTKAFKPLKMAHDMSIMTHSTFPCCMNTLRHERYLLVDGKLLLNTKASKKDVLRAVLVHMKMQQSTLEQALEWSHVQESVFYTGLQSQGWLIDSIAWGDSALRFETHDSAAGL